MIWPAAPKPKIPRCFPSPAITSERQPIRPAHSKGAMATSSTRFPERKAIAGIGEKVRGKATIAGIAREQRTIAKIFLSAPAVAAFAAGVAEPGDTDAL